MPMIDDPETLRDLERSDHGQGSRLTDNASQVNVPKTRRTYCKGKDCRKHTQHKVTQYKAGKVRWIGRNLKDRTDISRPRSSHKESAVTIANSPATVVRQNPCSTRRRRQQRRSC